LVGDLIFGAFTILGGGVSLVFLILGNPENSPIVITSALHLIPLWHF